MQNEKQGSATEAAGYIAGVGIGMARLALNSHFRILLLATIGLFLSLFVFETGLSLVKILILYCAVVALVFGHAFLRKHSA